MPSIFILGATGYVGGAVLHAILKEVPDFKVTALVRNDAHITILEGLGVTCIKGNNTDPALVSELASKADVVVNCADADDAGLFGAIMEGLKLRFKVTSVKPLYMHTSGTGVFIDRAGGVFNPNGLIYDDKNEALIKSVPISAPHRKIENLIIQADGEGFVSAYIVSPSFIYGTTPAAIPRPTLLSNLLIRLGTSLQPKALPYVGDGSNVNSYVHVSDASLAYVTIMKFALSGKDTSSGWGKYFNVSDQSASWKDVVETYGKIYEGKGIISTAEPALVTVEQSPFMALLGSNVNVISSRLHDLGWKPNSPSVLDEAAQDAQNAIDSHASR